MSYDRFYFTFTEFISEIEVRLLMGCLPHNIKIDSAPFRQQLGSNLKKLLVRLRDSCVTMLKDTDASGELLSEYRNDPKFSDR